MCKGVNKTSGVKMYFAKLVHSHGATLFPGQCLLPVLIKSVTEPHAGLNLYDIPTSAQIQQCPYLKLIVCLFLIFTKLKVCIFLITGDLVICILTWEVSRSYTQLESLLFIFKGTLLIHGEVRFELANSFCLLQQNRTAGKMMKSLNHASVAHISYTKLIWLSTA